MKARGLFYVMSVYCSLLILNNMPSYDMLKAMFEGSQGEYFQKEIKKLWEIALKAGVDSLLFQTVGSLQTRCVSSFRISILWPSRLTASSASFPFSETVKS